MNQETKYQLVKFNEDGLELEVTVSQKKKQYGYHNMK